MKGNYHDALFAHRENNKLTVKAWVFENDIWGYRVITPSELERIYGVIVLDTEEG